MSTDIISKSYYYFTVFDERLELFNKGCLTSLQSLPMPDQWHFWFLPCGTEQQYALLLSSQYLLSPQRFIWSIASPS